jgi:hypothetical protein
MQEYQAKGRTYRLASNLKGFRLGIYTHLTDRKWANWTEECGYYRYKDKLIPYDILLPDEMKAKLEPVYRPIVDRVLEHQRRFPFKLHKFVGHMASSQAACLNLFVPLLLQPSIASDVLRMIKPDLQSIATDHLDGGFQVEFWPGKGLQKGLLQDHTTIAGTDADIAIAYRDREGHLRLWLIEHKLTEQEFTTCGGAKSSCRTDQHRCSPAADVLSDHSLCYYHEHCKYAYWPITDRHSEIFSPERLVAQDTCPFKGGLNQLWRNMLLAMAVQDEPQSPYAGVHFSVVHHPDNHALDASMKAFQQLLGNSNQFSWFTSDRIVNAPAVATIPALKGWATWYKKLYRV